MEYRFRDIEIKWQEWWKENNIYKVQNDSSKPKCYVLDMFPYPSGAGLHVGHPLGYIASDIYARFKRLKGFNVLHPMGYDAFGLPAEQYAIDKGIHPAISTAENMKNFRGQLDKIGFSFDWSRELSTADPAFYKWTQWIFLQLFKSFYNRNTNKAEPITFLVASFEKEGNAQFEIPNEKFIIPVGGTSFNAAQWKSFDEFIKESILMEYRLAYCGFGEVNWCEALGTVLANDEVINGVSERGGFPVIKKRLRQWYLRITEYADRLLEGLDTVDFSDAMKEMQSNWIGKSMGAEINFRIDLPSANKDKGKGPKLKVYTTRPDTIFGVDFMVIAPEHEQVERITSAGQKEAVEEYLAYVKSRSERERMAEKKISGVFTGSYALNPFDGRKIPIWIAEYVLAGYGTGAIMGVPCGDERDHKFALHFNIPITNIIGSSYNGTEANPTKDAVLENSGFLNGMIMRDAIEEVNRRITETGIGIKKVNYKMRDASYSRQRYWGEPFPIVWKNNIAYPLDEKELPLELPHVDSYGPGPDGEGPLSNIGAWTKRNLETNTMPGYAGSSWYFFRYMDPHNEKEFCDRRISDYWGQVDLYIGGTEHAVGHLLYSRMWTKALYDLGYVGHDEPYKKLMNQGMIQGSSRFVYRIVISNPSAESLFHNPIFVSYKYYQLYQQHGYLSFETLKNWLNERTEGLYTKPIGKSPEDILSIVPVHADVNMVDGTQLDIEAFKNWRKEEYRDAIFICENGSIYSLANDKAGPYICGTEVEKMSKSKFNTVNPDDLVTKYGADTFRMYEMFLGPVEMSKPWDTKGIEGVHRFLKKFWRLFYEEETGLITTNEPASAEEKKILHKAIRKIEEDTERFSFNTAVSAFMIATNELTEIQCHKKAILEPLLILLAPYAPHISEELYSQLQQGIKTLQHDGSTSILNADYPVLEAKWLVESSKEYPVSINGKLRTTMHISLDVEQLVIEKMVLENAVVQKWLEGRSPKKIIYVKNKMINVVI